MKSANTVLMWDDEISSDENMYVNRHNYQVWYKEYQIGYMKSDKSCIDPFYDKVYNNLKSSKEKEKFKEVAPAAKSTPASFLLDTESEVEEMLKSVKDYCGAEVLSDCRFGERVRNMDRRKRRMKDKIKYWLSILCETIVDILYFW